MEINTKYEIGQKLYFISDEKKACFLPVFLIACEVKQDRENSELSHAVIKYTLGKDTFGERVYENDLFESMDDLIKSLTTKE